MIEDDALMRIHPLRLLTALAVVLALALPAAGLGARSIVNVDRGVVQSVNAGQIVLRTLDGGSLSFQVVPRSRVRLNGRPASIAEIAAGFVAEVSADRKGHALVIRAFGTSGVVATTDRGVVTAVSKSALTVTTDSGTRTIALDGNTRFRVIGLPAGRQAVRPGALVTVTHAPEAPAQVVNVLKRAGA
jgi:hypothetical protein